MRRRDEAIRGAGTSLERLYNHTSIYTVYCVLWEGRAMATNLAIDDALIEQARELGGLATKKAVVTQALVEYIQKRRQHQVTALFGSIAYDKDYDYKALRKQGSAVKVKRGRASSR